jgi:hypothetical protein
MRFFSESIAAPGRREFRRGFTCADRRLLSLCQSLESEWQELGPLIPQRCAKSRPARRARLSIHSVSTQSHGGSLLLLVQSPHGSRRTALDARYRLRAGYATLLRLAGRDRTRRDRDRLGADDSAAPGDRASGDPTQAALCAYGAPSGPQTGRGQRLPAVAIIVASGGPTA